MKLRKYQKELINSLENENKSLIKHSRRMGITTVLSKFIAKKLLETNTNNIVFIAEDPTLARYFFDMVSTNPKICNLKFNKNRFPFLELNNGNSLRRISTTDTNALDIYPMTHIIIDNACFINNLQEIINKLLIYPNIKIIIASGNKPGYSYFNELFNDNTNYFIKHKIHWKLNEEMTTDMIDTFKRTYGYTLSGVNMFNCEMELEDLPDYKTNKEQILTFRVNDKLYVQIRKKLMENKLSISDYLRNLIEKDIYIN